MSDRALNNFYECYELLSNVYEQVDGEDFYRYIFPNNENAGELHTDFSRPNAIYLYQDEQDDGAKRRLRRRIMLNDTWADDYRNYVEGNEMTLCSGLTYHSRSNKLQYAQTMNALIFDLDGVGRKELESVLERTTGTGDVGKRVFPVTEGQADSPAKDQTGGQGSSTDKVQRMEIVEPAHGDGNGREEIGQRKDGRLEAENNRDNDGADGVENGSKRIQREISGKERANAALKVREERGEEIQESSPGICAKTAGVL